MDCKINISDHLDILTDTTEWINDQRGRLVDQWNDSFLSFQEKVRESLNNDLTPIELDDCEIALIFAATKSMCESIVGTDAKVELAPDMMASLISAEKFFNEYKEFDEFPTFRFNQIFIVNTKK